MYSVWIPERWLMAAMLTVLVCTTSTVVAHERREVDRKSTRLNSSH